MAVNGALPQNILLPIDSSRELEFNAANSWFRLLAAVQSRYGWTPTLSPGYTAYRSYDKQVLLFNQNYSPVFSEGDKDASHARIWQGKTYWRRPGKPSAATPGTSNHGWGVATDVANLGGFSGTRYRQFGTVASGHGWNNSEGRGIDEAWHWVYARGNDSYFDTPTPKPPAQPETPTDPPAKKAASLMYLVFAIQSQTFFIVAPDITYPLANMDQVNAYRALGVPEVSLNDGTVGILTAVTNAVNANT